MAAQVVAYTDPGCPHCRRLKEYLQNQGVQYENRDVSTDASAARELQQMNAPGVPVTRVGSDVVVGFDPNRLGAVLQANRVTGAQS